MKRTLFALIALALLSLGTPLLAQDYQPPAQDPAPAAETETPSDNPDVDVDASLNPPDVDVDVTADTDADTDANEDEMDEDALPATASELPLVGLLGLAAVGAGLGLSVASRRK
jgi:hypothetical protein